MCFGNGAATVGAKEVVKEALRCRRPVVEEEKQMPGKRKKKEETNNSINEFLMAVLSVQQLK